MEDNFLFRLLKFDSEKSTLFNVFQITVPMVALATVVVFVQYFTLLSIFPDIFFDPFYFLFVFAPIVSMITTISLCIPVVLLNIQYVNKLEEQKNLVKSAHDQLEINIKQRTRFVAYVSHEIRNPLNGIIGIAESLDANDLDQTYKDKFRSLKDTSLDLITILNDILDFSKIDSGELDLNIIPVNLKNVINDLQEFWMPRAISQGLDMRITISENFPDWVYIDPSRFRQVANNLLSNALKYTDQGFIEVTVVCDQDLKTAVYCVLDTGPGIPDTFRNAIFDPYYQVPSDSDVPQKMGTGLGLPIARQLAGQMGGDVWMRKSTNNGSHFCFSFEIQEVDVVDIPKEDVIIPNIDFTGKSALVVDDVRTNQMVASEMLKKLGFEVEVATNGVDAIKILDKNQFDCVLLDDELGDMRGHQVLDHIIGSHRKTKFIAYTGNIEDNHKKRFFDLGMHGFVAKPVRIVTLKNELDRVFSQ